MVNTYFLCPHFSWMPSTRPTVGIQLTNYIRPLDLYNRPTRQELEYSNSCEPYYFSGLTEVLAYKFSQKEPQYALRNPELLCLAYFLLGVFNPIVAIFLFLLWLGLYLLPKKYIKGRNNTSVRQQMNGQSKCGIFLKWNITQIHNQMKS